MWSNVCKATSVGNNFQICAADVQVLESTEDQAEPRPRELTGNDSSQPSLASEYSNDRTLSEYANTTVLRASVIQRSIHLQAST